MRTLVTGGTGVIGEGLIPELLAAGHQVRLLTRGADDAAREWPAGVESYSADVTRPEQLIGAADGCDAVVHISGIIEEAPPEVTYKKVHVGGTRNLVVEATRAGHPKFILISSLGADRGSSAYHASKRDAESIVQRYGGAWAILRPGNVYGPGDDVISKLLTMVRTLPVVPVIGSGDHEFQPIWYADLGKAITRALDADVNPGVYELAGAEATSPNDVLSRLERITGRHPMRVPVPEFLTSVTTKVAGAAGVSLPIKEAQFVMLIEHNVITPPSRNALTTVFGVTPTPLDEGLTILADAQPEQLPEDGVGGLEEKRFWADITGSRYGAEQLMEIFRRRITEIMPIEFSAEPGAPREVIEGATLTAALPLRGNIQIRVEEVTPTEVTFATLRGHPMAGVVRFSVRELEGGALRFLVSVFARAATRFDWVAMSTVGSVAQNSNWQTVVERMVEISGGTAPGVETQSEVVSKDDSAPIEQWISDLVAGRKRIDHARHVADS